MTIEDIIYVLNKNISLERKNKNIDAKGHLVVTKTIIPDTNIKAFKQVNICLWYILEDYKVRIITVQIVEKILFNQKENAINRASIKFIFELFKLVSSNLWYNIIKEDFNGNKNEQISNTNNK